MTETFEPTENLLREHFRLDEFRRGQREIITSILNGKDALAVLPTGGGKSLCYQYPALALGKVVIVVSPLIALMKDQVAGLKRNGIPAGALHSAQSNDEKREVFRRIQAGGPFILYLSPERVAKEGFHAWIQKCDLALFAIDEAHCVSQWGHDFRAEYSQLKSLKELRPDVPLLALTASATPLVLNDISKQLGLKSPDRHVHGFYRPNLYYQVETCEDDHEKLRILRKAIYQNPEGRLLVYCGTRKVTEELAAALEQEFNGVGYYHAGLSTETRNKMQEDYAEGRLRILTATNAFGMGIDHPNVRLVVHFQMPGNIDSLYQEMGRAGRDGLESTCLMLYAKKDKGLQSFFITNSDAPANVKSSRWRALENLVEYAEASECRHAEILTYYQDSQRIRTCGHCDVCAPASSRKIVKPEAPAVKPKEGVRAVRRKARGRNSAEPAILNADDSRLFEILRLWRREKASELDVPAFVVFSDRTLRHLAQARPRDLASLADIHGLGAAKIERFGPELLRGPLSEA